MMTLGRPTTSIEPDQSAHAVAGIGSTRCRANAVNFEQPISFPIGHMFGIRQLLLRPCRLELGKPLP
jgi:hypothetical protein